MATIEKRIGASGKATWRVRVRRLNGPPLSKSFTKKTDAEEWSRGIEHKIDAGEHVPSSEARKRTVADVIDRYLTITFPRAQRRKNASEQIRLLNWWREAIGTKTLISLTPAVVAEARDALAARHRPSGKPLAGSTVNRHMAALSGVLTVAVREYGWLPRNPISNVTKYAESKGRERFLSDDERAALLTACDASILPALPYVVRLALATGARKSELLSVQWKDVDLTKRTARFRDTKNGEARTVPLATAAVATLKQWRTSRLPTGAVFAIPSATVHKYWRMACNAADLHDVRFHDLRHSAASYLAMSGASLMDIAAILGHKTLAMVKRYSHLSEQHTTAAIDRMAEKFLK